MEENKQINKELLEEGATNSLKIGDIALQSDTCSIDSLCAVAIWLLKDKTIREYLDLIKIKKGGISYTG